MLGFADPHGMHWMQLDGLHACLTDGQRGHDWLKASSIPANSYIPTRSICGGECRHCLDMSTTMGIISVGSIIVLVATLSKSRLSRLERRSSQSFQLYVDAADCLDRGGAR